MPALNFRKIIVLIKKYPWRESALSLKFLPKTLGRPEKIALIFFFFALMFSLMGLLYFRWIASTRVIAQPGGVWREGIVGESREHNTHASRLLNAGLTKYDNNRNIVGDLAEKWEINDEGKVYVFHLRPQVSSEDLASRIIAQGLWQDIDIATPDSQTLTFTFSQPFSPFLYTSTSPIFPYGPYRITRENKTEVEFMARDDYYAGRPYIDKIIFHFFLSRDELIHAAKRGDIDGFSLNAETPALDDFQKFEMKLPRRLMIFFNLSRDPLKDINVRKALKENASPGKAIELRLVTSDTPKNVEVARQISAKWEQNGVKINLDIKDNVTLQKTTIAKRDYDALLYGLDYGEDPDPYPFWHSSQIKEDGRNLSNFKNNKADRLLEDARQEFDFAKREQKYADFQKILDSEIPAFTVEEENLYWQAAKVLKGISGLVGSSEADRFLNVSAWYINTKRVKK